MSVVHREILHEKMSTAGRGKAVFQQRINVGKRLQENSARTSAPTDSSSAFKKDGTAIVYDTYESLVQIIDPSLPMSEKSSFEKPRMHKFRA